MNEESGENMELQKRLLKNKTFQRVVCAIQETNDMSKEEAIHAALGKFATTTIFLLEHETNKTILYLAVAMMIVGIVLDTIFEIPHTVFLVAAIFFIGDALLHIRLIKLINYINRLER